MFLNEIDFSVFTIGFDAHARGKQCIREVKGIEANSHPHIERKLSLYNQQKLLEYAAWMIRKMKREELSLSSFEKNLSSSWTFCLLLGEKQSNEVTEGDLVQWWEQELQRYEAKKIKHGTLRKEFECCQTFLKWLNGLNGNQKLPLMLALSLPRKPKPELVERMPTQEEVKQLIDAAFSSDKYSIRNQAIIALANDSGARISEILSMQNQHVRPEKNYLVVSFPESKTAPRTVISFLAKPFLENWAKVSPNKNKGPDAYFFCREDGTAMRYGAIKKAFDTAKRKVNIPWKSNRALHYFRNLFSSRAYDWPYTLKHYWLGWAFRDHEKSYTQISYTQCVDQYFSMIKKENNPMLREEIAFWEDEDLDDKLIQKMLLEKPEFRLLLKQVVREIAND